MLNRIYGYKIVVVENRPKLHIRDSFEWITDEARQEINTWLAATFGYTDFSNLGKTGNVVADNHNRVLYMDEKTKREFQQRHGAEGEK